MTKIVELPAVSSLTPQNLSEGLKLEGFTLPNGLKALYVRAPGAPVFTFQTWVLAGSVTEKVDPRIARTGLAHLFEHLMFRGTRRFPDGEFDEALTRAGGVDLNASTWYDRTNYYVNLPSEKLGLVLDLESDRFENLSLTREVLETEKGAVVGEYELGLDDPETVIGDRLYETAFEVHPYRVSTIGTRAEIESFTLDDADYFYSTYYTPGNTVLIAVGDVDGDEFAARVAEAYGGIRKGRPAVHPVPAEPEPSRERRIELTHAHLETERLVVAYRTPPVSSRDFAPLWILQSILSEGRTSVLGRRWVEDGLASSASGDLDQFRDPGLLAFDGELQSGVEPLKLLSVLDRSIDELRSRPALVAADLERARNQILLRTYEEWEEFSGLASFLGESLAATGDAAHGFRLIERVRRVRADEVMDVLNRYLAPARRTVLVARPGE